MRFEGWADGSVLEAASWRLAAELARRHPSMVRLIRGHPGGGLSDCLWLLPLVGERGDVRLNRNGTIQVLERFDGHLSAWEPVSWDDYLRADPRAFLNALETEAGLPKPNSVPSSTPRTLTLRVLAAIAATGVKSVQPIEIASGMLDTSGGFGGGPRDDLFAMFPAIPPELKQPTDHDFLGMPEYRFWFVLRNDVPMLAFEEHLGLAWTAHHDKPVGLMDLYQTEHRNVHVTTLTLLSWVDQL